jgi:hypothetical protein
VERRKWGDDGGGRVSRPRWPLRQPPFCRTDRDDEIAISPAKVRSVVLHWCKQGLIAMQVVVRIRVGPPKRLVRSPAPNRGLAQAAASALWPLALACFSTCLWRWSYELGWAPRFLVSSGALSHWQIWFVAGGLLQFAAVQLAHYAKQDKAMDGALSWEAKRMPAGARSESARASALRAVRTVRAQNRLLWPDAHAPAGRVGSVQIP